MDYTIDFTSQHSRIIILLDLDFFYGQVEQVRDPRLQGLPFCIKQKHIVVTASYPARKLGVKKLQLWTEAKKACPGLITIVGEDLTQYRLASKGIRDFVTSLVWEGKVEKLGLDELFLDVTDQVNTHLQSILPSHPAIDSLQTFQIDRPADPFQRSFTYPFGTHTGFLEPSNEAPQATPTIPYSTLQLFVASHFAQHIRAELFASQGYTTSAGIASTKLLSKLLSDLHKPALQSLQNPYITPSEMQSWLDTFKVEKLNGFGFRTGWILRNKILGEEIPAKGTYGDADKHNGSFSEIPIDNDDNSVTYSDGLVNGRPHVGGLSVGKVRTSCTSKDFLTWFGTRLGSRLWELLHGIDSAEVISTPTFPKQISVEDSYPDNRTLPTLFQNLSILTKSLVRRLDLDLRVAEGYVRFPKTLRLSMRNGRQIGRESKSARMPVELFDLTLPTERRVEAVGWIVNMLARGMVAGWPADWRVGVINVAATDLMEEMPGRGIQGFIDKPKMEDQVDWDVIRELPEDIRAEVMRQYHLSPDRLKTESSDDFAGEYMEEFEEWEDAGEVVKMAEYVDQMEQAGIEDEEWDDDEGDQDMEDTKEKCEICGVRIFSWMREAHARYHESL